MRSSLRSSTFCLHILPSISRVQPSIKLLIHFNKCVDVITTTITPAVPQKVRHLFRDGLCNRLSTMPIKYCKQLHVVFSIEVRQSQMCVLHIIAPTLHCTRTKCIRARATAAGHRGRTWSSPPRNVVILVDRATECRDPSRHSC